MELKFHFMIYIAIALAVAAFLFFAIYRPGKKGFKDGKKIAGLKYISHSKYFKFKKISFRILSGLCLLSLIASMVFTCLLVARPYYLDEYKEEKYSRDIILCMDISTSVDELNSSLMNNLKQTVKDLEGERIGIVIFNTTAVELCPLTDDYEYVLDVLDKVEDGIEVRGNYINYIFNAFDDDDWEKYEYIDTGTLINNSERGSSLIGDGLASAAYCFTDDDPDRSKVIIFSTDNALEGTPLVTTQEACDICTKKGIVVYGVGTYLMEDDDEDAMKEGVESTGGKYYREDYSGSMKQIVSDIEEMSGSLVSSSKGVREIEKPELFFYLSMASVILFIVTARVIRL